jgi:hypothetical protein
MKIWQWEDSNNNEFFYVPEADDSNNSVEYDEDISYKE